MPSPRATSPASASREMREVHLAKTAEQVAGAFRAAARARRGRHQRPVEVLTRAFAASSTDGRVTPEEFRAAATKLGLAVPLPDALAVFDTTEHVMRSEADGKENDDADAASNRDGGADDARPASSDASTPLLLYLPWIESVLGISSPGPRGGAAGPSAPPGVPPGAGARPTTATAPPTRRGPLRDTDPLARETDAFVYPHCRTSVFPPPGWDHTHVARGTALPDITLELDHVHGCGPGLVDQTSPVPIFCIPARVPAKPPKRGEEMDERARMIELKLKEEAVFFAAGVGVVQTMRADGRDPADVAREEAEREAAAKAAARNPWDPPTAAAPPRRREPDQPQRHFRGHADDVRCLTIHETTRNAASGEMGVCPAAMVWSIDAKSGQPPLAVLRHPRGARAVICAGFDVSGDRLATVCGDDGHTVTLWEWNAGGHASCAEGGPRVGRMLWSARSYQTTPPAVRGILFTPSRVDPDLFVTFGTTHVRFWRPEAPVPVPDGDVGSAEAAAAAIRTPWRTRAGKNVRVEDVSSGVFLDWSVAAEGSSALRQRVAPAPEDDARSDIDPAEDGIERGVNFVSGSPRGDLLFWKGGDGTAPAVRVPGSRHRAAVQALALSADRRHQGAPRLLLSGDAAGAVMCWAVNQTTGTIAAPLGGLWLVETPPKMIDAPPPSRPASVAASEIWLESDLENEAIDTGDGEPLPPWLESYPDVRGLAWSPSGKYYLVTTAQGSVWRVNLEPEPDSEDEDDSSDAGSDVVTESGAGSDDEGEGGGPPVPKPPTMRVIVRGHDSALTCVAWSSSGRGARLGLLSWYATGSTSGRVVIWNAKTRESVVSFDAGGAVRSLAFSPDGNHLAAGLDRGKLSVFSITQDPTLAPPNNVLPRFHAAVAGELRAAVTAVSYSPDGRVLAAGDGLGNLELYRCRASGANRRTYRRRAKCVGHCSAVLHVDWSADSRVARSSSTSYEILHHESPGGARLTRHPRYSVRARESAALARVAGKDADGDTGDALALDGGVGSDGRGGWHTWTTPLGFELMGVWPKGADGTDINEVWRTSNGKHVFSADDSGHIRVLNFPCAVSRAPSLAHKAHSSHVSAARGSWCDAWVASAGGRDCCVMQWRVVRSKTPATIVNLFDLTMDDGRDAGVAGFDRSRLDEGVVEVRTLDAETAAAARAGNVVVEDSDEESSDGDDDGIWNQAREYDVAEVDDVYDDMMNDIDIVVPEQAVNKNVRIANYALKLQKPGKIKTKLWETREEVAERRRILEHELRNLGRDRASQAVAAAPARDRAEWQPAPSARGGPHPDPTPPPPTDPEAKKNRRGDADGGASDAETWSEAGSEEGDAEAKDAAKETR